MTTKRKQNEENQYPMTVATEEDAYPSNLYRLALLPPNSKAQQTIDEEAENRQRAIEAHKGLARQAHAGVGSLARVAGTQFHSTIMHHAELLAESKGTSLHECEQWFARQNLQQTGQNMLAVNDGAVRNFHEQATHQLHDPNRKRKWYQW